MPSLTCKMLLMTPKNSFQYTININASSSFPGGLPKKSTKKRVEK